MTPGYGNPWCYVFDSVGPGIRRRRHDGPAALGLAAVGRGSCRPPRHGSRLQQPRHAAVRRQRVSVHAAVSGRRAGAVHLRLRHQHERHAAVRRFTIKSAGFVGERIMKPADRRERRQAAARRSARQHRQELPAGRSADRPGRRAVVRRLVQRAHRPHAVLAARSEPRSSARPHLSARVHEEQAARAGHAVRQERSRSCSSSCASTSCGRATGRGASCATGRRTSSLAAVKKWVAGLDQERSGIRSAAVRSAVGAARPSRRR